VKLGIEREGEEKLLEFAWFGKRSPWKTSVIQACSGTGRLHPSDKFSKNAGEEMSRPSKG